MTLGEAIAHCGPDHLRARPVARLEAARRTRPSVVEQRQAIPLALRGRRDDGWALVEIMPVEDSHALQSLTVTPRGAEPIEIGSDGQLRRAISKIALGRRRRRKGHAARSRPDRRPLCRGRRGQDGHRHLRDRLPMGRRRPVRRPLPPLVGLSRISRRFLPA